MAAKDERTKIIRRLFFIGGNRRSRSKEAWGWIFLPIGILILGAIGLIVTAVGNAYVLEQVEMRVRDTMLQCRAFHEYVQNDLHPAYYKMMEDEYLPAGFYAPELLSSSYITRNFQKHYTEERQKYGLPEITYKMAAVNPRNEVNEATPLEAGLIDFFNENPNKTHYSEVIKENGEKYFLYAQPFLRNEEKCLKCHGEPDEAPTQLRIKYNWTSGFQRKVGDIVAVETFRSPLEGEFSAVFSILLGFLFLSGLGLFLLFMNQRLRFRVSKGTEALQESEERLRAIFDSTRALVYMKDRELRYTHCNPTMEEHFELSHKQILGKTDRDLFPEEKANEIAVIDYEVLKGKTVRNTYAWTIGCRVFLLDTTNSPVRDSSGRVIGLCGVSQDITEQTKLREENDKLVEQYHKSQKMEAIGSLAGGLAHDLNNLLTPVLGYGETLLGDSSLKDSQRASMVEIQRAAHRAKDLVRQLLAFGRKQTLEIRPVDLNKVIKNFEKLLLRTIRENIKIQMKLDPDPPATKADVNQIERVIMNLVINAQDAMPDGGNLIIETSAVELAECREEGHLGVRPGVYSLLTISDDGCGMDSETCEHIFDPFFTTKIIGKGNGLGLATVYGIIKQHSGNVMVNSKPGRGTAFKVYLPATYDAEYRAEASSEVYLDNTGTETVMVVEEYDMVRNLAVRILERKGYRVLSAENGSKCLDLLENHRGPLDLILMNMKMPDMNGKDLYKEILTRYPLAKVLYMSGLSNHEICQQGNFVVDAGFIKNPFSVEDLSGRVREVLDGADSSGHEEAAG
ncbi:MAG: DUF3365 domain-containing protein [Candidatus Eisenbacteria bacterium]|nr:DUF3365 domain-containing protein [Candidatus Eisenbacteria bacterium]